MKKNNIKEDSKRPGLWANIRAKRARGEKPAHKNSKAHKDAVKAGKKINAQNEGDLDAAIDQEMRNNDSRFETEFPTRELRAIKYYLKNPKKYPLPDSAKRVLAKLKSKIQEGDWPASNATQDRKDADARFKDKNKLHGTYLGRKVEINTNGSKDRTKWEVHFPEFGTVLDYADVVANLKFDDPNISKVGEPRSSNENIDKVSGGIPYRVEGGKAIINMPLPDDAKERIIKRAKEHGYLAQPNMAGGVTITMKKGTYENFKDGKKKGKSRPGRVKRSGASCSGSVTDLRAKAKNASGEKQKMYHWCANMKSGRKK